MMVVTIEPWMMVVMAQLAIVLIAAVSAAMQDALDSAAVTMLAIGAAIWVAPVLVLAWAGA